MEHVENQVIPSWAEPILTPGRGNDRNGNDPRTVFQNLMDVRVRGVGGRIQEPILCRAVMLVK